MKKTNKLSISFYTLFLGVLLLFNLHAWAATMDAKAKKIADEVVDTLGGREKYDATRYITWVFAGKNFHIWDKYTGNVRIENKSGDLVLMNINTKKGRAWEKGREIKQPEVLAKKINWGYKAWTNDSYWLVLPYKLHDDGVTLKYTREDKTADGKLADVLTMTFESVGVTPNNKYELFIEKDSHMLSQWRYYINSEDTEPRFELPLNNWAYYGDIMLSDGRGKLTLNPINVYQTLPSKFMTSSAPIEGVPGAILKDM